MHITHKNKGAFAPLFLPILGEFSVYAPHLLIRTKFCRLKDTLISCLTACIF